jgi:hypothetical protein
MTLNLQDFQCIHNQGILHKYARKSDGAIFSVKSLIASNQFKPEHHPVIQTLGKLSQHNHPNLPRYYGYTTTKTDEFTDILVFLEDSEGALFDYLKEKPLTKVEINALANELIDFMIFIDRNAYSLPGYITPYNILVSKDASGKTRFKPFAILPYDENRKASDEDLKWVAPELYERIRLKRLHVTVNAEKAMFYSIGVVILYCSTQDVVTDGRDRIEAAHFTTQNQERETEAVTLAKAKALSLNNDNQLNAILDKLMVYSDKERADFRIWQHVLKDAQGGKKGANPVKRGKKEKYENNNNVAGGAGASGGASGSGKNSKNSCKSACCNMF